MGKPEKIKACCVCGCGMGSSLLLKILLEGVCDEVCIPCEAEAVDSGSVPNGINLVVTSTAFEKEMIERFKGEVPVIAIKNFYENTELKEKLQEIGYI